MNELKNKTVLVATGLAAMDRAISNFEGYEVIANVEGKEELIEACNYCKPDILIVSDNLPGKISLMQLCLQIIANKESNIRIVYITSYLDMRDETRVNSLGMLVMAGIYDIIHEQKITPEMIKRCLDNPKTEEFMSYLTKKIKHEGVRKTTGVVFVPEENDTEELDSDIYENMHVVSSIKPGTGKSFLSTNLAAAVAAFGVNTKSGKRPRVAIIEADLQNLSVGTLLQIEDDKHNLKSAMDRIRTIISPDGELKGTSQEIEEVNEYVRSCFKSYYKIKNLEALVGSQLTFQEIEDIKGEYYTYLLETIVNDYDVVIIDSNSSLTHVNTFPILHMAKYCYYVLNLDFNNVRNNVRYKTILAEMGIADKIRYVLNEDIVKDTNHLAAGEEYEDLIFSSEHLNDSKFKLEAKIPEIPKTVFLNRLYEGTPIVLDDKNYTLKARYEILKVANQIWPIQNFDKISADMEKRENEGKKKKGWFK